MKMNHMRSLAVPVFVLIFAGCAASQSQTASLGNRHVKSSADGGKPDNAIGYASEGNLAAVGNKENMFTEPLDPALREKGVTEEDWRMVQTTLRERWHLMGTGDFEKAIAELDESLFFQKGCVAVYAEYGAKGGQKAITIYTREVWDSLPR